MDDGSPSDHLPPQNLDAEAAVIGALLLDPSSAAESVERLAADDFYSRPNQIVYDAILGLIFKEGQPNIDALLVGDWLEKHGTLNDIGGRAYLHGLLERVPSAANVRHYARIVRNTALRRELLARLHGLLEDGYSGEKETATLLNEGAENIIDLIDVSEQGRAPDFKSLLTEVFKEIEGTGEGVKTGYVDLDDKLGGLGPGEFIILAGRPSMGKTTLAINIVRHVAGKLNLPVLFFSLEMPAAHIARNYLFSQAKIEVHKAVKGNLTTDEHGLLTHTAGEIAKVPLLVDEGVSADISYIVSRSHNVQLRRKRKKEQQGLALIVVDYIQLVGISSSRRHDNRQQEITEISRSLKQMARGLKVPVLAISQLNRSPEARDKRGKPRISDLRESGALEQDADKIVLLYRPDLYEEDDRSNQVQAIVAKNRNGPTGETTLTFLRKQLRFENYHPAVGTGTF